MYHPVKLPPFPLTYRATTDVYCYSCYDTLNTNFTFFVREDLVKLRHHKAQFHRYVHQERPIPLNLARYISAQWAIATPAYCTSNEEAKSELNLSEQVTYP